jgi:hypothetical protein
MPTKRNKRINGAKKSTKKVTKKDPKGNSSERIVYNTRSHAKRLKLSNESRPDSFDSFDLSRQEIDPVTYNSASSVHNYMLNDPILDYFIHKNRSNVSSNGISGSSGSSGNRQRSNSTESEAENNTENNTEKDFFHFITQQGNLFEKTVIDYFFKNFSSDQFVKISYGQEDILKPEKYNETLKAIHDGVPVIYQGVLHDHEAKTYGSPDLIIRSDYLEKLCDSNDSTIMIEKNKKAKKLKGADYHYVIVDIKYNTLKLTADGYFLLNVGRNVANKGQLLIYNRMLSKIQGLSPEYTYIIGRGFEYTSKGTKYTSRVCNERLGHINCNDQVLNNKVDEALLWLTELKQKGHNWLPGSRSELFPNMCNKYDAPYHGRKQKIAHELDELTLLWNVGVKHRENAHEVGVYKLSDHRLSSEILGINGKTAVIVDKIIEINNNSCRDNVRPKIITNNDKNWQQKKNLEFYIDFETVNEIFEDEFVSGGLRTNVKEYVFMIGLLVVDSIRDTYNYYCFIADELSVESENKIFQEFLEKVKESTDSVPADPMDYTTTNFYHWGSIEKDLFYKRNFNVCLDFCDLCSIFRQEPIVVKGAYSFSLKDIGKALVEKGIIKDHNWSGSVTNGLAAMVMAANCYKNNNKNNNKNNSSDVKDTQEMKEIEKYNKIDCLMLYEIIKYLRNNHVPKGNNVEKQKESKKIKKIIYESEDEL